jgi:hypothetical protein
MGYRSNVAYVIRFENTDQRDTFVELVKHRRDDALTEAINDCETRYEAPIITYYAEDIKWYEGYEYVEAHKAIMEWAVELYKNAGYRIVQVGEDGKEEVSEDGDTDDLYDYIYSSHEVHTDFPALKQAATTQE